MESFLSAVAEDLMVTDLVGKLVAVEAQEQQAVASGTKASEWGQGMLAGQHLFVEDLRSRLVVPMFYHCDRLSRASAVFCLGFVAT